MKLGVKESSENRSSKQLLPTPAGLTLFISTPTAHKTVRTSITKVSTYRCRQSAAALSGSHNPDVASVPCLEGAAQCHAPQPPVLLRTARGSNKFYVRELILRCWGLCSTKDRYATDWTV
eukprot:GHUV01031989.1.p1 GENE.GHUV01031989.1~~GHUV01031989.1.p1  ORF type:complete len:120 (-),score=12.52 GHUV01031989.1:218-577(-)